MTELSYKIFFKAISNSTRFRIITLLKKGPKNVSGICAALGFEQSRVSHNLKCLQTCGFVNTRVKGKNRIYELDKKHIIPLLTAIEKYIKLYDRKLRSCELIHK